MVILFMRGRRCVLLISVVIMVDWSMVVSDRLPSRVDVLGVVLGVVRVVIGQVRSVQNCVLVEVLGLNVVLVVECVVQLGVVAFMLAVMAGTVGQKMLLVAAMMLISV